MILVTNGLKLSVLLLLLATNYGTARKLGSDVPNIKRALNVSFNKMTPQQTAKLLDIYGSRADELRKQIDSGIHRLDATKVRELFGNDALYFDTDASGKITSIGLTPAMKQQLGIVSKDDIQMKQAYDAFRTDIGDPNVPKALAKTRDAISKSSLDEHDKNVLIGAAEKVVLSSIGNEKAAPIATLSKIEQSAKTLSTIKDSLEDRNDTRRNEALGAELFATVGDHNSGASNAGRQTESKVTDSKAIMRYSTKAVADAYAKSETQGDETLANVDTVLKGNESGQCGPVACSINEKGIQELSRILKFPTEKALDEAGRSMFEGKWDETDSPANKKKKVCSILNLGDCDMINRAKERFNCQAT